MNTKRLKYTLAVLLLTQITFLFAGAFISYFHGRSNGDNIVLDWQTGQESHLKNFVIERKTPISGFVELATINSKGNNSNYTFTDDNAYKTNDAVYIYRLRLNEEDGNVSFSSEVTVTHGGLSGVKRTWGSIKALFR